MEKRGLRMNAYYFGFVPTGVELIDRILSAVACAGKAYHHTEDWGSETERYEDVFRGTSPVEWIERAAQDAAAEIARLTELVRVVEAQALILRDTERAARLAAEGESATMRRWVDDLQSGMYINCVYCGHRYGPGETTPVSMADALKAHVEQCPKHPMSALKAHARAADAALAGMRAALRETLAWCERDWTRGYRKTTAWPPAIEKARAALASSEPPV